MYVTMNSIEDIIAYVTERFGDYMAKKVRDLNSAAIEAQTEYFKIVEQKIRDIVKSAVDDFYSSYTPERYPRKNRLYNILRIDSGTQDGLRYLAYDFDPSVLPYRDGSGGGKYDLYTTVFRRGFHGGAASGPGHPEPGFPYWRAGWTDREGVIHYTNWFDQAAQSTAPLDTFREEFRTWQQTEGAAILNKLYNQNVKKIK